MLDVHTSHFSRSKRLPVGQAQELTRPTVQKSKGCFLPCLFKHKLHHSEPPEEAILAGIRTLFPAAENRVKQHRVPSIPSHGCAILFNKNKNSRLDINSIKCFLVYVCMCGHTTA